MAKLYVNTTDYIEVPAQKPAEKELFTAEVMRDFSSTFGYLPNPDTILAGLGKKIDVYRGLAYDAKVKAVVGQLTAGVKSLEWDIDRGRSKGKIKKEIEEWTKDFNLGAFIEAHVGAWLYGYQPMEAPWQAVGDRWFPRDFIAKPQEWFVHNPRGFWAFLTKDDQREGTPIAGDTRNFLFPTFDSSFTNPYGIGALSGCFWPVTFKRGGMKFWLLFVEKFGMPHVVVKVSSSANEEERAQALSAGKRMIQDAVLVINDTQAYEMVEAAGKSASSDLYREFLSFNNDEIALSIIHQTMSSDVSDKGGGYASSKTGEEVLSSATWAVARAVEYSLSKVFRWITEVNWATQDAPEFILYKKDEASKELAERDNEISGILEKAGKRLSVTYLQKRYYFDDEDIEDAAPAAPAAPAVESAAGPVAVHTEPAAAEFAGPPDFPDQAAVDAFADAISDEQLQEQMEPLMRPVFNLVAKARDFVDAVDGLAGIYPDLDAGKIEQLVAEGMYRAEILGRLREGA
jgi:phage gp29-like protein